MSVKTARINDDENLIIPVVDAQADLDIKGITTIRTSPYHEKSHLLDLTREETNYQIVALALQSLHPVTEKYAFESYYDSFNIAEIIHLVKRYSQQVNYHFPKTTVYIIAFRSILFEEIKQSSKNRAFLASVDKASHAEANESGGLLKYWFGVPDDEYGQNLATCWWVSKKHAKLGGGGPAHRKGMNTVKTWFKHWKVEEYELTIEDSVSSFSFNKQK